jgi:uncharacterized protein (UPF0335 family)
MSNAELTTYARQAAAHMREIDEARELLKDVLQSAKDAGINTKALRKVAKEMTMEQDKREKIYEDEAQLSMFRDEVGLTQAYREAAE